MNDEQAFETLLASVAAALDESLARHAQAALQGDLDTLNAEADRQRKLVGTRTQLQILRDAWPLPLAEPPAAPQPEPPRRTRKQGARTKKLKRGQKTPQGVYYLPILQALEEMGGRGVVADVLDRVGEIMADELNQYDRAPLKTGDIRWRNTAQWARHEMKEQGLLAGDSPMGIWEMTERGRRYLCEREA
ncbi:MAG: winged helix-turn-helix domain-containing protein [Anaerolineae bacterium]|nr:winged helix-turn-helix domain-containing protein [Anaerolineae bacterium]